MRKMPVTALLLAGMIAFARPTLAGSDNPPSFSALQNIPAERLSEREMASITGKESWLVALVKVLDQVATNSGPVVKQPVRK